MIGQPVIIPGSMGTASWLLTGTATSMQNHSDRAATVLAG
jgi:RNA-splicing ligase RtcB